MVSAEGIVRQLDPELSLTDEIRPYIISMIKKDHGLVSFGRKGAASKIIALPLKGFVVGNEKIDVDQIADP